MRKEKRKNGWHNLIRMITVVVVLSCIISVVISTYMLSRIISSDDTITKSVDITDSTVVNSTITNTTEDSELITVVDIFKPEYESEYGISVQSDDGANVIAPGTSNEVVLKINNTSGYSVECNVNFEATTDNTNQIPILVSLKRCDEKTFIESDNKQSYKVLNDISDDFQINNNSSMYYTLSWEWPFEDDADIYDTALGNYEVSTSEEVSLTITMTVNAKYIESVDDTKVIDNERDNDMQCTCHHCWLCIIFFILTLVNTCLCIYLLYKIFTIENRLESLENDDETNEEDTQ